jgi:hypothetical protein
MNREKVLPGLALLVYLILFFMNVSNPLFWDTIQYTGFQSLWYYQTNLKELFLPNDTGLYSIQAYYIAICFKLFGKSLLVAHLAMLPILLILLFQLYLLVKRFIPKYAGLVFICLLADPALASQSILVSPDLAIVCLYLLCLNAILDHRYIILTFCLPILSMIHIRGTIAVIALGITQLIFIYFFEKKRNMRPYLNMIACYLPSIVIFIAWQYFQFLEKGWWIHGPNQGREIEGFSTLIFNFLIIGKNFLDTGRVIIWIILIPMILYHFKAIKSDRQFQLLLVCFIIPLIVFSSFLVLVIERMIGHRYYMICYVLITLITCYGIFNWVHERKKLIFATIIIMVLISGNFWVWPDTVSKGWDSILAHVPYYNLKKEMFKYIKSEKLDPHKIATGFPDFREEKYSLLNDSEWHIEAIDGDIDKHDYIYQSNVHNDFSDEQLSQLKKNWIMVKEIKSGQVYVRLYKNPSIFAK